MPVSRPEPIWRRYLRFLRTDTNADIEAAVASLAPTWRAARVDPSEALPAE